MHEQALPAWAREEQHAWRTSHTFDGFLWPEVLQPAMSKVEIFEEFEWLVDGGFTPAAAAEQLNVDEDWLVRFAGKHRPDFARRLHASAWAA